MLKDLKVAFCSAAVASASVSQAGAFGYGIVVAISAALLSALGRVIWRLFLRSEHDEGQFVLRDMRAARRRRKIIFNPLLRFFRFEPGALE